MTASSCFKYTNFVYVVMTTEKSKLKNFFRPISTFCGLYVIR
uniref:Uncharacterized protein n=1 Tax=Anguilla anguilla TaxID=7936 RepID=A0A0E9Q9G5_ANGAN